MSLSQRNLVIGGAVVAGLLLLIAITTHHRSSNNNTTARQYQTRTVRTVTAHAGSPEELTRMIKQANQSLDRMHNDQISFARVNHAQRL